MLVVGLVGVGLIVFTIRKKGADNNSAPVADQNAIDPASLDQSGDYYGLPSGAVGDYLNSDPTNPAFPVGQTPGGIPGPVTNVQWSRLVFDYLVSRGGDPALIERALAKYLAHMTLTTAEQAVVNEAHQYLGAPPEGLILTTPAPTTTTTHTTTPTTTTTTPTPTTTTTRRYVYVRRWGYPVTWDMTLSGIAGHYNTTVARLAQINHISNPDLLFTGQKIYIDP
jgi:LysM repeat protein